MAKYVVTGSSGRIGRALHFALSLNHTVVGIDLSPSSATSHIADIGDIDELKRLFEGASAVFHSAALHAPHVGLRSEVDFQRVNIEGTQTVVAAAKAVGVPRLVFTSTTALYGHASQKDDRAAWINEDTTPEPRTVYHRSKLEAEALLRNAADEDFLVRVIRMSRSFPEPAPQMASYRLHRGIDPRDVADIHIAALRDTDLAFDLFVASGQTPFLPEDAEALKLNASEVIRLRVPELARLFEQRGWSLPAAIDRVYDPSKAANILGWTSKYGFHEVASQLDARNFEVLPTEAAGSSIIE